MRRVAATLTLTASVALGALAPANAYEKTIHVWHWCSVTVSTADISVMVDPELGEAHYYNSRENPRVSQDCVTRPW